MEESGLVNLETKCQNWREMELDKLLEASFPPHGALLRNSLFLTHLANLLQSYHVLNWKKYNESLVRRGEILLDFDVIDNWDYELEKMNQGKEGRKFVYPDSFIKLLGYMRAYFHLPYRQTEGVVRAHAANTVPSIPDYSRICRRINRLNIKINDDDDNVII